MNKHGVPVYDLHTLTKGFGPELFSKPGGVAGKEAPTRPLMFQGNHGNVAYRNIRIHVPAESVTNRE
jgi:hypothetical protein